jgi:methionyl-tRNA synthetase
MDNPARYLLTAALPYANGPLHVGHLTGAYLPGDIYARYLRLNGHDVLFVCGSDEHGAAITMRALAEETTPRHIIDKYHALFVQAFDRLDMSFDIYHRTSEPIHHETSQEFFKTLYEKGEFLEQVSEQYYDAKNDQFLADRYIVGTCPKCGHEEAYGDQCENCGSTLSPSELINPKSKLTGETPELKSTRHWFLPLDKHEAWLRSWIEEGNYEGQLHHYPTDWKNHVIGQCKSWLDSGLTPRAMTRDLDWGVDVPQDIEGSAGKKLYVWLDAPIGYISASRQWAINQGDENLWKKYWQAEDSSLIHFIGKDNIVFHCLIFPAILKAHGGYNLPINVPANQFMNLEGRKISTSRNWAVWVNEFVEDLPEYIDVLRYYLIKNMPEQRDSEFTWKGFQDANDNELVNNLANFINRVVVLTHKYFDGKVPMPDPDESVIGPDYADEYSFLDAELLRLYDMTYAVHESIMKFDFRAALLGVMEISSMGNQFLQNNEPWKLIKTNEQATANVLYQALQIVYVLGHVMSPFMPAKARELMSHLNVDFDEKSDGILQIMNKMSEDEALIEAHHELKPAFHLFSRIPDEVINTQIQKLNHQDISDTPESSQNGSSTIKSSVDFNTFQQLDLRTGSIIAAEKIKKADKLLKLTIDLGFETRTVVSGIAEHFAPEEIIGQQITVVANLEPRKLRGVESKGMILMAEDENGKLMFVSPPKDAANGLEVR